MFIEALHRVLPASVSIIPAISRVTADNIFAALDKQQVAFSVIRLGNVDWELESAHLTDDDILSRLHMEKAGHTGQILICTEACTRYGKEPFTSNADELTDFVTAYDIEMFFDGDVIILSEESRIITVYHHAGGYLHVAL